MNADAARPIVQWWRALQRNHAAADTAAGVKSEGIPPAAVLLRLAGSDETVTAAQLEALARAVENDDG